METKICSKCNIEKTLENFTKHKISKDGLRAHCKECQKNLSYINYQKNKDKIKERKKNYYNSEHGKLKEKERRRKYYLKNKETENARSNKWNEENKEKMKEYKKEYSKIYREKNKEIIAWRRILHNSLKKLNKPKEGHTIDLLGYSALELKEHIQSLFTEGMSWDNYGEWHIDHIKPIISFEKTTPINIVNALSNLRPMWSTTREINGVVYKGLLMLRLYFSFQHLH